MHTYVINKIGEGIEFISSTVKEGGGCIREKVSNVIRFLSNANGNNTLSELVELSVSDDEEELLDIVKSTLQAF
jgi:hypothetical protein